VNPHLQIPECKSEGKLVQRLDWTPEAITLDPEFPNPHLKKSGAVCMHPNPLTRIPKPFTPNLT